MAPAREPTMGWLFFSPSGRLGRGPFAAAWLFWVLLASVPVIQIIRNEENQAMAGLAVLAFFAVSILATVSTVLLTIKRLHDMGVPGALSICLFIPAISIVALIIFSLWPGKQGANEYGTIANRPQD